MSFDSWWLGIWKSENLKIRHHSVSNAYFRFMHVESGKSTFDKIWIMIRMISYQFISKLIFMNYESPEFIITSGDRSSDHKPRLQALPHSYVLLKTRRRCSESLSDWFLGFRITTSSGAIKKFFSKLQIFFFFFLFKVSIPDLQNTHRIH